VHRGTQRYYNTLDYSIKSKFSAALIEYDNSATDWTFSERYYADLCILYQYISNNCHTGDINGLAYKISLLIMLSVKTHVLNSKADVIAKTWP